jgi:hypothetical protein
MTHRDAEITDVMVVLDDLNTERTDQVVEKLKAAGMTVTNVDDEQSVVEGSVESSKVHDLKDVDCVRYVRTIFTYTADYPCGDPRDKDGPEEQVEADE